jgi:hypothetical protein
MAESTDYNNYIFNNRKFIGDFEAICRNSAITPFHQDEQSDWIYVFSTKEFLSYKGHFKQVYDFGCSTEYYFNLFYRLIFISDGIKLIFNICKTTCQTTQSKFTNYKFHPLNLTETKLQVQQVIENEQDSVLWEFRSLFWNLVESPLMFVRKISKLMKNNSFLLVFQNFLPIKNDFLGKSQNAGS